MTWKDSLRGIGPKLDRDQDKFFQEQAKAAGVEFSLEDAAKLRPAYTSAVQWHNSHVGEEFEKVVKEFVMSEVIPMCPKDATYQTQWRPPHSVGTKGQDPIDGVIVSARHVIGFSPKYSMSAGNAHGTFTGEYNKLASVYSGRGIMHVPAMGNPAKRIPEAIAKNQLLTPVHMRHPDSTEGLLRAIERFLKSTRD